jgi:hypothetical protein
VLEPLIDANTPRNLEFGAALCSAANLWLIDTFASKEKRLKVSILISAENTEAVIAEIERYGDDPQFAQISAWLAVARTDWPHALLADLRRCGQA